MAFCSQCGATMKDDAAFCPSCGKPAGSRGATNSPAGQPASPTSGLQENVASLLCYLLGWVTGLIFFFVDKRPTVRWHAAQSIVVFGSLNILAYVLGIFFSFSIIGGAWAVWSLFGLIHSAIWLVGFVLWIVCMVKAYQGVPFRVPVAADVADSFVKQ